MFKTHIGTLFGILVETKLSKIKMFSQTFFSKKSLLFVQKDRNTFFLD